MKMQKNIFLSGGGNEIISKKFDDFFIKKLKENNINNIIYIPIALRESKWEKAKIWFSGIFEKYINNIEVYTDLSKLSINNIEKTTAIYIGGGDTVKLLKTIRDNNLAKPIINFINNGGFYYGGSAGAIICGKNIKTAPEARGRNIYKGFNVICDKSIVCHYKDEEKTIYDELQTKINSEFIILREGEGIYFDRNKESFIK